MASLPAPFRYRAEEHDLADLRQRLARTRLGEALGPGWGYGTDRSFLDDLLRYWTEAFDWRTHESRINAVPSFTVQLHGRPVHFVHVRSGRPGAVPLLMTHGWPSSFLEMLDLLPILTDGGDPPFDVVVPSMPGYGFSAPPAADGQTPLPIADMWRELMVEVLGYERFVAHGGDIGAGVTIALARRHPAHLLGIHLTTDWADDSLARRSPEAQDREYLAKVRHWEREESAYGDIQGTKPQTLAVGLNDSPAGLAAWMVEKWRAWSDRGGTDDGLLGPEQLLPTITLYWLTGSVGTSFLPYYRYRHTRQAGRRRAPVTTPTGIARMPGDEPGSPSRWVAERQFNLVHWSDMPRGGHFAALEVPELLAADLRVFARVLRDPVAGRAS